MSGSPGKTLEMMQKRKGKNFAAMAIRQEVTPTAAAAAGDPPAANTSNADGGRPKGKNFAAMAKNATPPTTGLTTGAAAAAPAAGGGTTTTAQPQSNSANAGKPKGKDFGALASRMGGSPDAPQQQQHQTEAQLIRAREMQASARAAAGLPPLDKYTATSVTTVPPPLGNGGGGGGSTTSSTTTYQHSNQRGGGGGGGSAGPSKGSGSATARTSASVPSQVHTSHNNTNYSRSGGGRSAGSTSTASSNRRGAPSRKAATAAPISTRPTAQPNLRESSLSLTNLKQSQQALTAQQQQQQQQSSTNTQSGAAHLVPLIGPRLHDLVRSIDGNFGIDSEAQDQVLQLADDFLDKVLRQSLRLAQHRGSKILDVQDVQLVLAKHWGIVVPGLGLPHIRPVKPGKSSALKGGATAQSGGGAAASGSATATGGSASGNSGSAGGSKRKAAGDAPGASSKKKTALTNAAATTTAGPVPAQTS